MFRNKKIDLHLHFDGSLPIESAYKLARELGMTNKEEFVERMQVNDDCHSLYDYLERFDLPIQLLQTEENLYKMMVALIESLDQKGYLYAEIRFAPMQHIKEGLTQKQVVETLCKARTDALRKCKYLHVNYILCMMILGEERLTNQNNVETLYLAKEYCEKGVVAVDLAGAEGIAPMEDFRGLFELADQLGLIYTIHAGENYGPENIKTALSFGAKRIGHGTSAIKDREVMNLLKEKQIPLEVCVTSNIQSEVIDSFKDHPVHSYFQEGIPVCLCTDNMTISNTDLENEYEQLIKNGWNEEMIKKCLINSVKASFMKEEEKKRILKLLN